MNKDDIVDVTHGFGQTLLQMVREWRAGLFGRGGAPQETRLRNESTVIKVATCQESIVDGEEGEVILEEGEDGVARAGDTITVRNLSGANYANGEKVAVTWPVKGRWVILPSGRRRSGDDLPVGGASGGCGCSACIDGSQFHKCALCGCFPRTVYTDMPVIELDEEMWETDDSTTWEELQQITTLKYKPDRYTGDDDEETDAEAAYRCIYESKEIDGPPAIIEEPDDEDEGTDPQLVEVRDKYKFEWDFATGIGRLVRTVDNGAPLITLKYTLCVTACLKKCQCPVTLELAPDGVNNVYVPNECKLCITPQFRKRPVVKTEVNLCGDDACTVKLSDYATLLIKGTGKAFPGMLPYDNANILDVTKFTVDGYYELDTDHIASGLCCSDNEEDDEICWTWGQIDMSDNPTVLYMVPDPEDPEAITGQRSHDWRSGAFLVAVGDLYQFTAVVVMNVTLFDVGGNPTGFGGFECYFHWTSALLTCEELNEVLEAEKVDLTPACRITDAGEAPGTATLYLNGKAQKRSTSTGHLGSNCGGEGDLPEPTCTEPCVAQVYLYDGPGVSEPTKAWGVGARTGCDSENCHCSGFNSYSNCMPVFVHDTLGPASAHDVGYEAEVPCEEGGETIVHCDSVPASLNVTCGESTGTLSPPASNTIGITCNGDAVSIELTYSCENNCPTLTYDVAPGCSGTAVLEAVVSMSPLDVTFSIPAGVCCSEGFSIHITE